MYGKNPQFHGRSKHIAIKYHFIREQVINKQVKLEYCPSQEMVTSMLTKGLNRDQFEKLIETWQDSESFLNSRLLCLRSGGCWFLLLWWWGWWSPASKSAHDLVWTMNCQYGVLRVKWGGVLLLLELYYTSYNGTVPACTCTCTIHVC